MNEAELKSELVANLKQEMYGGVFIRHEDIFRSGIPDLSVTWNRHTTWWEAKYANPRVRSRGVQLLTARMLEQQGHGSFYIIWDQRTVETYICSPNSLHRHGIDNFRSAFLVKTTGFDHQFVVRYIRRQHGDHQV